MSTPTSKIVPKTEDKVNSFHVPKKEEDSTLPRKHGAWSWLIAPDGNFSTVNESVTKVERREIDNNISPHKRVKVEKPFKGGWIWLVAPDESAAVVEPKREDDIAPKADDMPLSAHRKRKFQCKWNWLLAPDGTPATLDKIARVDNSQAEELTSTADMVHAKDPVKGGSPWKKALDAKRYECPRSRRISDENHERWERNFQLLVDYKKQYKTTRVPIFHPTLGAWTQRQRQLYKRNLLTKYRQERLESINFVQNPWQEDWMKMYDRLLSFKKQHHCSTNLPRTIKQDEKLTIWMLKQRQSYTANKLSEDKILLLESIGFEFELQEREVTALERDAWMKMYQRLVAYKEKYKNTRVPVLFKSDPKLACWVMTQRRYCSQKDRVDLLNSIGFEWSPHDWAWMKMYKRLLAFQEKHEHTRVPQGFGADPQLGNWVYTQRKRCSQKDRVDLLNDIGFEWDPTGRRSGLKPFTKP